MKKWLKIAAIFVAGFFIGGYVSSELERIIIEQAMSCLFNGDCK